VQGVQLPSCFIAMPVSTSSEQARIYSDDLHFSHVLEHLMVPAVEKAGYEPIRPTAIGADLIHAEIIRQLETTDLVLCDISTLNPNVFFELGIRTAVDRPVCVVKDDRTDQIPFDTGIINVYTYGASLSPWVLAAEVETLAKHLQTSAERSKGRNTLWRYFGLTTRAAFQPGESTLEEKVDLVLLQLRATERSRRIEIIDNPNADFLLFSQQARNLLRDIDVEGRVVIGGINDTMTIDMKGLPISSYRMDQIDILAKVYGFEVRFQDYIELDEDS
jgi:hypothetical protein